MNTRLSQLVDFVTNGNKAEFARQMGWKPQYINSLIKEQRFGLSPIIALLQKFPNLDARWLILGEGSMFITDKHITSTPFIEMSVEDSDDEYIDINVANCNWPENIKKSSLVDHITEMDLRTPLEKERDAIHQKISQRYAELAAQHPTATTHRLQSAIAAEFNRSIPNIRAILIKQGVIHKK
jgi:hypothetical protein